MTVSQRVDVEVDINLADISTDDLREELEIRGDPLAEDTGLRAAWAAYNAMTDDTPAPIRRFIAAACGWIW